MSTFALRYGGAALAICLIAVGCVAPKDTLAEKKRLPHIERPVAVEYGKPNKFADGLAAVVQFPRPWQRRRPRAKKYYDRDVAVDRAADYLEDHGLDDVLIEVRRHDPIGQWRRLRENTAISPWSRYPMGTLSLVAYNLLPPRVWGFDEYNPFTNTLYLNTHQIALSTYRAAGATQLHGASFPGLKKFAAEVPPFSMFHDHRCTTDLIAYARQRNDWEMEKSVYQQIYPAVGANVATLAYLYPALWVIPIARPAGAIVGGVAGAAALKRRKAELAAAGHPVPDDHKVELATYHEPAEVGATADQRALPAASQATVTR